GAGAGTPGQGGGTASGRSERHRASRGEFTDLRGPGADSRLCCRFAGRTGRPLLMLWTYVPATVLNVALNLYVVPRYGMFGAAWTALGCQWMTVVTGWFIGTSLFPVWLPLRQTLRCVLAVVPMIAGLTLIRFPLDWFGLCAAVGLGALLYSVSAVALDVGGVRWLALEALRQRLRQTVPELMD